MTHHTLDIYPIPKDKSPMYINEPWLIDGSIDSRADAAKQAKMRNVVKKNGGKNAGKNVIKNTDSLDAIREPEEDNIRVYIPVDLNKAAILRRLNWLIGRYGEANEGNESDFGSDVDKLIAQIEIYDQIWYVRHMPKTGKHSEEAKELVREFVSLLEQIPDGCAECFPFETIDELRRAYLGE